MQFITALLTLVKHDMYYIYTAAEKRRKCNLSQMKINIYQVMHLQ